MLGQLEQGMGVPFFLYHQRKEDRNPYVWGRFSLTQIMEEARASTKRKALSQSIRGEPSKIDGILSGGPRAKKKSLGEVSRYKATLV